MKCDEIQAELLDFGMGLLSGPECQLIKTHLSECKECAALLEEELAFAKGLSALPLEQPAHDVWPQIEARTSPKRSSPATWLRDLVATRTRKLAVAALAAAVMAATVYNVIPQPATPVDNKQASAVMVKWSDDPLAGHADALVDSIDHL